MLSFERCCVLLLAASLASGCAAAIPPLQPDTGTAPDVMVVDAGAPRDAVDITTIDAETPLDVADALDIAEHVHSRVGSHGFLITGSYDHLYLSHLPAFYEPHTVQVIVEGHWAGTVPVTLQRLSGQLHSFLPEPFSLDALRVGDLRELRGMLFIGNHEQGGAPLAQSLVFTVTRVLHQHELDGAANTALTYLIAGEPGNYFAWHFIGAQPSFDHLVAVDLLPDPATSGLPLPAIVVTAGVADTLNQRLSTATTFTASSTGATVRVTPRLSLSCLVGPGFGTVCP